MKTLALRRAANLFRAVAVLLVAQLPTARSEDNTKRRADDLWKAAQQEFDGLVLTGNQRRADIHIVGEIKEARRKPTIDSLVAALSDREFGRGGWLFETDAVRDGEPIRLRDVAAMLCARLLWISDPKLVVDVPDSVAAREAKIEKLIQRAKAE